MDLPSPALTHCAPSKLIRDGFKGEACLCFHHVQGPGKVEGTVLWEMDDSSCRFMSKGWAWAGHPCFIN